MKPFIRQKHPRLERLVVVLALLALLIGVGTTGYVLLEEMSVVDSFYTAVIIVTTVGYGMVDHQFSSTGKIFTALFALTSVGTVAYLLSSTIQLVVNSELVAARAERRRRRDLNNLQSHFIICGAGRVGRRIISEFERAGAPFAVIEQDAARVETMVGRGIDAVCGDATLEETLRLAGVERARGLAACLPDDADNLYVVLTARDLSRDLYIVARAIEEQAEAKLVRAGASRVVAPTIIGSHRMAQSLLKPTVADFIDSIAAEDLDLGFEEVEVSPYSSYVGRQLRETNVRAELNIVIVAIKRRGGAMIFNPSGEMRFERGDLLVAIGQAESLGALKEQATGARA